MVFDDIQSTSGDLSIPGVQGLAGSLTPTIFASCAAAALGLAPADASAVIPRSIAEITASSCSSSGADSCCCVNGATVQFDVTAADVAVANAYAAAMTDSLTGPAMVQCLNVSASQALKHGEKLYIYLV